MLAPLATWLASLLATLLINIIWGLALAVWYLQKALAWLGDQVVTSNIWETIIDGLLTGLADSLPDTLSAVLYGTGGGLFYLALILLGITFIIPYITNVRPALEIERVLGWTIFATFLFISSTAGYDLVGAIELYRMEMMTDISSNYGSNDISQLVAGPMSATPAEINVNEFVLPVAFEEIYFPDPAAFETVEVIFYDAPIIGANTATLTIETEDSLENRRSQATLGLVLVILNIVPTVMVVILTAAFVGLTGTALILILFFLMALPLGMFESGMLVIQQIIRRYMLIWILSVFMAVFPGILLGVSELTLTPPVNLENLFLYIGVLLVAVYATYHVARWIFNVATESFSVIGQSINAVAYAGAGGLATAGQVGGIGSAGAPMPHALPPSWAMGTVGAAMAAPIAIEQGANVLAGVASVRATQAAYGRWDRTRPIETEPPAAQTNHVFMVHQPAQPIVNQPEAVEPVEEGEWHELPPVPQLEARSKTENEDESNE